MVAGVASYPMPSYTKLYQSALTTGYYLKCLHAETDNLGISQNHAYPEEIQLRIHPT
jgi:hypothetical protein